MINKTINGYTIKHLIGSGGMADVYYAENKLDKKAAIKVLKSEFCAIGTIKERFEQEARIMVDIEHKHIRQAYDLDEISGQPAIIMEYLEGHTLKQLIDKGKISDEKAQKYFEQCVDALKVTHSKEIVHRDIKPSNIFITQDDEVKILDFGIAKVAESSLGTRTNQMLGAPVYMSPEQIKSPKNIDTKSDVYSLAVTFYHALTGKVPYDSTTDSDFEIQRKIVYEELDLSKISSSWTAILRPMLAKATNQRCTINDVSAISGDQTRDEGTQYDSVPPIPEQQTKTRPEPPTKIPKWLYYLLGGLAIAVGVIQVMRGRDGNPNLFSNSEQVSYTSKKPSLKMISIPGRDFKLSETEVTIGQYLAFCKATNSHWPEWLEKRRLWDIFTGTNKYKEYDERGISESNLDHPIAGISALDAEAFCSWIGGRLPTEQEWEFAAKGGQNYEYAGSDNIDDVAWYELNSGRMVQLVRGLNPNGYGLYDMSGNVWEWTSSKEGNERVVRGGHYYSYASGCRVSDRFSNSPGDRADYTGFRIAASANTSTKFNIKMISIPGRNFKMSETEVTIGQYLAFCKATNSHWPEWLKKGNERNIYTDKDKYYSSAGMSENNTNHPITGVTPSDADAFCRWWGGRLPTEEEWEYAAKGGENYQYAGSDNIDDVAWYEFNKRKAHNVKLEDGGVHYEKSDYGNVHQVHEKAPNGYGLYDMSGNVAEWTSSKGTYDWNVRKWSYSKNGSEQVNRGGSWQSIDEYCRVSDFSYIDTTYCGYSIGFRLVVPTLK